MSETTKLIEHEFLSAATSILDKREARVQRGYWLMEDAGEDFCLDCIKAQKPDFDYHADYGEFFDGGYCTESDSCRICECGQLLEYTLTDYGVTEEMGHFLEYGFDWNSPTQCYEMARIAYGVYTDQQKQDLYTVLRSGKGLPEELESLVNNEKEG